MLSRAWRLTWAGRAAGLVVTFGVLAVLQDRDALPFRAPEVGILLVPVALGLALAAACAVASFASDVAGGTFGWRQPLGVLSIVAVLCGIVPSAAHAHRRLVVHDAHDDDDVARARASPPTTSATSACCTSAIHESSPPPPMTSATASPTRSPGPACHTSPIAGRRRARMPTTSWPRRSPTSPAGRRSAADGFSRPTPSATSSCRDIDGGQSTAADPIDPPIGLSDAFGTQLDLRHLFTSPTFDVFENTAAFPGTAAFTGPLADATAASGSAELIRRDLSDAPSVLSGTLDGRIGVR